MERKVTFSKGNQFRFIPLDEILPDKYNNRPFDAALFSEVQEHFMTKTSYAQKVQKTDSCNIHMKTSQNTFPVRLHLYKCGGVEVGLPVALTYFPMSPALIEDGIERFVQIFKDVDYWNDLDGLYYLVIECRFDEDNDGFVDFTDWFVAEPVLVKARHPKTMLLEYSNSFNKDSIIFEQTRQKFNFRIEAAFIKPEPKVTRTVFIAQGEVPVQISATATRGRTFAAGFTGGVPFWTIEKLNHIFSYDSVYIEGSGISVFEDSQLKYDIQEDVYGLGQASIIVTDRDNNQIDEFSRGGITMFEDAFAFPYVPKDTEIGYPGNYDYYYGIPERIASLPELEAWIAARNAELSSNGLTGEIAISSSTVVYNRGIGENYTYANTKVFRRRIGIKNLTTGVFTIPLELELRGDLSSAAWIVSGPTGNILNWGVAPDGNTFIPNYVFSYISPGAGTFTFELWHEGTLARVSMFGNSISGIDIYGLASSLPPLKHFSIDGSTKLTSFSLFGELNTLRSTLKTYRLRNNPNLTDIGVFVPPFVGLISGWLTLNTIILQNNRLSTATIDAWFNSMKDAMQAFPSLFYVYGGSIYVNGQTPAASVTAASAAARSMLINNYAWTITI